MKKSLLHFLILMFGFTAVIASNANTLFIIESASAPTALHKDDVINDISDFKAVVLSSSSIKLTWKRNFIDKLNYQIERTSTESSKSVILEVKADVFSFDVTYIDEGLQANNTYGYRIKEKGNDNFSETLFATTEDVAPATPSSLSAVANSSSSITLQWVDNADNETNYIVERSTTGVEPFDVTATLPADAATYENTGLKHNTTYYYRVKAENEVGASGYVSASATTLDVPPAAPSSFTAVATSSSSITLEWTDNADNETSYVIAWSTDAEEGYKEIPLAANTIQYLHKGLDYNTKYSYQVKAKNATGDSDYVAVSATTLNVAPASPTALSAVALSISSIRLEWVDNADNEDAYIVEFSASGAAGPFTEITATLPPNTNTYTHEGLVSNTTYYYRVKAANEIGSSGYSSAHAATKKDLPILPATNLSVVGSTTNSLSLTWTNNASNATGFILERTLTPNDEASFKAIATTDTGTLAYTDESLKSNTTYFYRIKAINKDGASSYGNIASGTTKLEVGPPAPPTLFTATAISTFQINLTWKDNADNETSYIIERATGETGTFSRMSPLPANTESYENIGLKANTTYYYRVIAKNNDGESVSGIINATTFENPQPPTAPSGLSAVAVSTVQINLSWTDNSNSETNFKIERATAATGPFEFVAAVGANVTAYQNFGLTANTTYYYRVQAISGDGASVYTPTAHATTSLAPKPPSPPSLLTANGVSTTQINLSWKDNSDNETGFVIERASASEGPFSFAGTVGANLTTFESTGLSANTTYYYKIRAINNDGTSGYSNTASGATLQLPIPPTGPSNLVAQGVSTTQINLSWQDNSSSETNFEIYRSITAEEGFSLLASVPANQTTYESTGLSPSTTYYYKVLASSKDGKSSFSNQAEAMTSEVPQPPAAPDGLTAMAVSTTQINLKWNDRSDNETNFVIERSDNDNTNYKNPINVNANDTTFESTGLVAGTTYFYRVRATNKDGNSEYSNEVSATALVSGSPPNAPSDLYGKALSQTSIELFWMDNANNEEFFVLERAEEKNGQRGAFALIETLNSNTTSYINSGLAADAKYWYRIKAKNQDGESAYTESSTIITSVDGKPVIVLHNDTKFPPFYIDGKEQAEVFLKVAEPKNIKTMKFRHKPISANTWEEKEISSAGNNEYVAIIKQGEDLDAMGIEYYFEAEDAAGNQYVSPVGRTYLSFEGVGVELKNLKFGSTLEDYQMITIPLILQNASVASVFEDDLGPYDRAKWRIFKLENNQPGDKPKEMDPSEQVEPGKGYWLIAKQQVTINTGEGHVVEKHQEDPFEWVLEKGWNFIGNPYPFDIDWNDVLIINGNLLEDRNIYTYSNKYDLTTTILKAFQGAYVWADEKVTIKAPLDKTTINNGGRNNKVAAKQTKQINTVNADGWNVNFTLKSGKLIYTLGGLGMHQKADLSKDKYDRVALPRFSEFIDINFEHPEYFSPLFTKDVVPMQESFIWDMKVVASSNTSPVVISWANQSPIPNGKNLILYDPVQQRPIDMKKLDSYSIQGGNKKLQVFYGDDEFIEEHLQPHLAQIGEAYPNPFIEDLFFPITLPKSTKPYLIKLQLFNGLGNKTGRSVEFTLEGGFHEVRVNETIPNELNNGLYFYKIWIQQEEELLLEKSGRILKK